MFLNFGASRPPHNLMDVILTAPVRCIYIIYISYNNYIVSLKWGINVSIVKMHIFDVQKKKETHIRVIRYNA